MDDFQIKSKLGSQAAFYFCATALAYLLVKYGFAGLSWRDAVYLVVGCFVAAVVVGNINWLISQQQERRLRAKYKDVTEDELGSGLIVKLQAQGRRLGTIFTLIAIAAGLATVYLHDALFPR